MPEFNDLTVKGWQIFLNGRMPEIMAADAALARVAQARALANDATRKATQLRQAVGPAATALRKAEARTPDLAYIRALERQLAEARAALANPQAGNPQAERARADHAAALAAAETAAEEATARKIALAHVTADARSCAVKPAIRAYANECIRNLERAGIPWEKPADMEARPASVDTYDEHGRWNKDLR